MALDDELCDPVLHAVYGLAKGRSDVPVKVATVAMTTGLDEADVSRAVALLGRDGRLVEAAADRVALSPAGLAAAKADAERESDVVFADGR